ncbi:hypothetical protein JCM8547_004705 [Rhodosporidiobolus lusitaniae]
MFSLSRPFFLAVALLAAHLASVSAASSIFNCVGGTVYLTAHGDDDLLFQSPDLYTDVAAGSCITTIIMTAGDSGTTGTTYANGREFGNEAAYANMADVDNTYTEVTATFGGQPVTVRTLKAAPRIQRVYFRFPDGNMDGSGFAITGYSSLRMLYFGSISHLVNQPKTATFTLATLKQALGQIITARQPSRVRTLDYLSDYDSGDHADHLTAARLAAEIAGEYASNATLSGYMGYNVQNFPPTLSTSDSLFTHKQNAFFAYTPYDSAECQSYSACVSAGRGESYWLLRQYIVTPDLAQQSYMGSAEAPVTLPSGTNIALGASVVASSEWAEQPASAVIDGNIQGYPGNSSAEWSSYGEAAGAWIQLTWKQPQNITAIVLNDRPNLNDWMTSGTLTFGDDATISFGALANDGSATLVQLEGTVVSDSIFLYVQSASASTGQVGLAEFQVFGTPCPGCEVVTNLTGSITKTSSGTTTGADASTDLALRATATASSGADGQGPDKANDGWIDGYKEDGTGNPYEEWASGSGVGTWLKLQWQNWWMIDSLVLYDRPNLNDQLTSGVITFSDGTQQEVTSLDNAGGATIFNLTTPVNTSSLLLTVTGVSDYTGSVGLAEIEAFYSLPQTPVNITSSSDSSDATILPVAGDLPDEYWSDDLALLDGVIATSSSLVDGQDPGNAINGDPNGYKEDGSGDPYQEWATNGEGAGAWINLEFPYPVQVSEISLFDRPNLNDWLTSAQLAFSPNGELVSIGALTNDGSATNFSIPNVVCTSIKMTVTSVASSTSSVGLAEFAVFGSIASSNSTSGSSTNSTTTPTTTSSAAVSLNTDLSASTDLAMSATASASGYAPGQGPDKAIDGYVDGYKESGNGSPYEEWASGQGVGASLTLTWPSNVTITGVALFDRPNLNDQILGSTITVDSGNVYKIGALPNNGTGFGVQLKNETTSTLTFKVTSVSSTTGSAGLSEIAVYGSVVSSSSNSTFTNSTTIPTTTSSAAVSLNTDLSASTDLAMSATASASDYAPGQGPDKAIDGYVDGYKESGNGSPYEEWASGQGVGATLTLTWASNVTITGVALFDRPNLNDRITGSTITVDSGNVYKIGALPNDGTGFGVQLNNETTSTLTFKVTSVSSATGSAGLSEIAVYGSVVSSTNTTSTLNSTSTTTASLNSTASSTTGNSSVVATASVSLNFTGSAPVYTGSLNSSFPSASIYPSGSGYNYSSTFPSSKYGSSVPSSTPSGYSSGFNYSSAFPSATSSVSANSKSSASGPVSTGSYNGTDGGYPSSNLNASSILPSGGASSSGAIPLSALSAGALSTGSNYTTSNASLPVQTGSASSFVSQPFSSQQASSVPSASSALPSSISQNASSSTSSSAWVSASQNATSSAPVYAGSSASLSQGVSGQASSVRGSGSSALPSSTGFTIVTRSSSAASSSQVSSSSSTSASSTRSSSSSLSSLSSFSSSSSSALSSSSAVKTSSSSVASSTSSSSAVSTSSSSVSSTASSSAVKTSSTISSSASKTTAAPSSTSAAATGLSTAPAQATSVNIARLTGVTVTASSHITKSPPSGAVDGKIGGLSALGLGTASQEWVASSSANGAWIELQLPAYYLVREIDLYARVSVLQGVTSGLLSFDDADNTVIKVGALSSSGSAVSLGNGLVVSKVRFTITSSTLTTTGPGLAEIQLFNRPPPTTVVGALGNLVGQTLGSALGLLGL